jgi:hypothetical protein
LPIAPANSGDHDIITGLVKDVANVDKKVDALSLKLDTRYTTVEEHAVVVGIQVDHEKRIRIVETAVTKILNWGVVAMITLGILETLFLRYAK